MDKTDLFLDKYKQLEEAVRSAYDLDERDSISYCLSNRFEFQRYKEDIKYCQDIRNLLSHKKKINGCYAVEPSEAAIDFIEHLIRKVSKRLRCSDIKIDFEDIYWQPLGGNVKRTVRIMNQRQFSQVPILKNKVVVGVFNDSALFNYLASNENNTLHDDLTFADMLDFISLKNRDSQRVIIFKSRAYVDELEAEFEKEFSYGRRIELTLLTANEKPDEELLGIITPWDIIAVED